MLISQNLKKYFGYFIITAETDSVIEMYAF